VFFLGQILNRWRLPISPAGPSLSPTVDAVSHRLPQNQHAGPVLLGGSSLSLPHRSPALQPTNHPINRTASRSLRSQVRSATGFRAVNTLLELSSLALHAEYQRVAPEARRGWSYRHGAEKVGRSICVHLRVLVLVLRSVHRTAASYRRPSSTLLHTNACAHACPHTHAHAHTHTHTHTRTHAHTRASVNSRVCVANDCGTVIVMQSARQDLAGAGAHVVDQHCREACTPTLLC